MKIFINRVNLRLLFYIFENHQIFSMYNSLKSIIKTVIPQKTLVKNEFFFRKLLIPFYKGENCQCNVCETYLKGFATLENGESICPICGSLPRSRRLYMLLNKEFLKPNLLVLDFSPFRILYAKLKEKKEISYFPSDFEDDFIADHQFDMRNIDTEDNKFDLIICYHILEHIIEDTIAMKELFRVLKKSGKVLVQTPFQEGEIYEDETIVTPADRLKHFGQDNHVRIYSIEGLVERLNNAGFTTEIRTLKGDSYFGFSENERIIICEKK